LGKPNIITRAFVIEKQREVRRREGGREEEKEGGRERERGEVGP
jgi:hypothetical protein